MSLPQCFPFTHKWRARELSLPYWQRWPRRTQPVTLVCAVCAKTKVK